MKLSTTAGEKRNPLAADLDNALAELNQPDGFVVLANAPEEYVQATAAALEYRDGTGHYRAVTTQRAGNGPGAVDRAIVRAVFVDFFAGQSDWKRHVAEWREVSEEIEQARPRKSWLAAGVAVAILAAAWVLYRVMRGG